MKFDFIDVSGMLGDSTIVYEVKFEEGATVNDLLNYALSNHQWGIFRIVNEIKFFCETIASCEFNSGVLKRGEIPKKILNKKIKRVRCNGGWGRMDYDVEIEPETPKDVLYVKANIENEKELLEKIEEMKKMKLEINPNDDAAQATAYFLQNIKTPMLAKINFVGKDLITSNFSEYPFDTVIRETINMHIQVVKETIDKALIDKMYEIYKDTDVADLYLIDEIKFKEFIRVMLPKYMKERGMI